MMDEPLEKITRNTRILLAFSPRIHMIHLYSDPLFIDQKRGEHSKDDVMQKKKDYRKKIFVK